ncbi:MAG: hypothetical protein GXO39_02430 [Thermotogae bacterium]|nr:hypothetical protein [Thermotogota bacterium]
MLGRLARVLRIMGFDTLYFRSERDIEILARCLKESRILLTADRHLQALAKGWGLRSVLLPSEKLDPWSRGLKIIKGLNLEGCVTPFSRCPKCNGPMETVPREDLVGFVHPYVWNRNKYFVVCKECGQIYWEGSHVKRIREKLGLEHP